MTPLKCVTSSEAAVKLSTSLPRAGKAARRQLVTARRSETSNLRCPAGASIDMSSPPPRIAMLMVSHSHSAVKSIHLTQDKVVQAWVDFVVKPLLTDVEGALLHTFLCFHASGIVESGHHHHNANVEQRRDLIASEWSGLQTISGSTIDVVFADTETLNAEDSTNNASSHHLDYTDQYERLDGCLQAMRQHEQRINTFFTHVIRARPELFFVKRIPRLADLDQHRVSLRARAMVFEPRSEISFAALVTAERGCEKRLFLTRSHANNGHCKGNDPKLIETDPACEAAALAELRSRMRKASLHQCVLYDDQFAVMPRHLADAYAAIEPNGGGNRSQPAFLAYSRAFDAQAIRDTWHPDPP